jgi:MOSC domain-containing protein YiiM
VIAVGADAEHRMSKPNRDMIELLAGLGVAGDTHAGATVQHRSRARRDPRQPNLRQVHLIQSELHTELGLAGFHVVPGMMGENITTAGLNLLALPTGTVLAIGTSARIEVTGLRNPCVQLDGLQDGLMKAVLDRGPSGEVIRKAGVMAIVLRGGPVRPGDAVRLELPRSPYRPLEPV